MSSIILIRNISPNSYGGAEVYQLMLAEELIKNHHHPIIVTSSNNLIKQSKQRHIKAIKAPFIKQQNWSSWRNLFLPFYFLWQLYLYFWYCKLFKQTQPIAINIQSRDDLIAGFYAAKKFNIKLFWTDHADFGSWVLQNVNKKYKNLIGKWILKIANKVDRIIMISDFEEKKFQEITNYSLGNIITIKNGVPDRFSEFQKISPKKQSIIYLGRLEEHKGIRELINAFKQISPKYPQAELHIYGAGSLEEYCRFSASKQLFFHGFTEDPLEKIAESEIFVLPSYHEGLSLSLIDATMLKKAIITTNIDGNPEVVEGQKNGILVEPKNKEQLATALSKLLDDQKLIQQFCTASRKKYLQEFNFSNTVKKQILPLIDISQQTTAPKVSVIVAAYNIEQYIKACLDSILAQTYSNFETVIIDDGSTDQTGKIIDQYKTRMNNKNIKIIHQKNQGLSAVRNNGIKIASGELVCFIDGDDLIEATYLKELVDSMLTNQSDVVVCGYREIRDHVSETKLPIKTSLSGKNATINLLLKQLDQDVLAWNKLYKIDLFRINQVTYPRGKIHEDNLTTYKIYSHAKKVSFIDSPLYIYQRRCTSITGSQSNQMKKVLKRLTTKEEAAIEAITYLKDPDCRQSAKVSLILAYFGFIDASIQGIIPQNYYQKYRKKALTEFKKVRKNLYLTRKLHFYHLLLNTPNGYLYKIFRQITLKKI